jgi:hypothetical protein
MWRWYKLQGLDFFFLRFLHEIQGWLEREKKKKLSSMPSPVHGGSSHAGSCATHADKFLGG